MATLYKTNGETVPLKRKRAFSVRELHKLVGGYFELIPVGPDHYLVVNEEGTIYGLPVNENATKLVAQFGYLAIVGDALYTEKSLVK